MPYLNDSQENLLTLRNFTKQAYNKAEKKSWQTFETTIVYI